MTGCLTTQVRFDLNTNAHKRPSITSASNSNFAGMGVDVTEGKCAAVGEAE